MMKEAFREQEPLWAIHDAWFDRAIHTRAHTVGSQVERVKQEQWEDFNKTALQAKIVCAWPGPRQRQK